MNTALTPPAGPAAVELVPDPLDPILTRPLALHAGHAYAAAWPLVTLHPPTGHQPPEPDRRLILIRDDGLRTLPTTAGDALVRLAAYPPLPADRLWTTVGFQAYAGGRRPDPAAVFHALTAVLDTFVDFTGSLGPQAAVCEYLAAYLLATWFLPAFTTFGHLWLLGDTGAGKTRLLHLLARLTHLGVVLPPSAPLTALRDLAGLGAGLAVDNADGLFASLTTGLTYRPGAATQRQGLFLSGARRDVLFPVRQRLNAPGAPAAYGLTHYDVFGPRLFAAQHPPPPGLIARAVLLPLLRSTDRARCAADPSDPAAWPVPPRALLDDLWALSLAHLPNFPAHVAAAAAGSSLVSAYFQTWHPVLAVGHWLSAHGLPGLYHRLRALANDYPRQTYHVAPQASDLTALTLQAIYGFTAYQIEKIVDFALNTPATADDKSDKRFGAGDKNDKTSRADDKSDKRFGAGDKSDKTPRAGDKNDKTLDPDLIANLHKIHFYFSASMLLPVIRGQAHHRTWDDLADRLTPNLIGKTLTSLRLEQTRTKTGRSYAITLPQLIRFIDAYRLTLPDILLAYTRFREETLRAEIPPGAPGAPLPPPSPVLMAHLAKLFQPKPPVARP